MAILPVAIVLPLAIGILLCAIYWRQKKNRWPEQWRR